MKSDSLNSVSVKPAFEELEPVYIGESISVSSIVLLLGIGLILFAAFYLVKRYILPYLSSRAAVRKSTVFVFRLEVLLWGLFILFALYQFLSGAFWITIAGVAIVAAAGFNFFRNFFVGLLFRLENKFEIGDPVRFDEYTGTIESIGTNTLLLKTEEEELVYLTYYNIYQKSLVKRQAKGRLMSLRIALPIGSHNPLTLPEEIKQWLFECPWAIVNERVQVQVNDETVALTVYAVDTESLEKVEEYLKKKLAE